MSLDLDVSLLKLHLDLSSRFRVGKNENEYTKRAEQQPFPTCSLFS